MILQSHIPYDLAARPLPGVQPLAMGDWLRVDEIYGAQMRERIRLLREREADVLRVSPDAVPATWELLRLVLAQMAELPGFSVARSTVVCPDGRQVMIEENRPLVSLCHLVQEDFCILEKRGSEHVLTAALLCFPASWTLAEKYLRPLTGVHAPVAEFDAGISKRVQRLFDGVRPGRPLWRFNALTYEDPSLYQPRLETDRRVAVDGQTGPYLRSERQSILRLPETGAVVFSIHTYVVARRSGAPHMASIRSRISGES